MESAQDQTLTPETPKGNARHYQKLAKDGGLILISQLIGRFVIRLGRTAIVARLLGPTNWGIFGMLSTIPELLVGVGNLGLGPAILYYVSKVKRDPKVILGSIIAFSTVLGVILIGVGFVVMQFDFLFKGAAPIIRQYSVFILLAIPLFFFKLLSFKYLVARTKVMPRVILGLIESALPLTLFIGAWFILHEALDAAAYSWFISAILVDVIALAISLGTGGNPPRIEKSSLKELASYGSKAWWTQCFQLALLRSDFVFISAICGMEPLGYYIIATRIAEIFLSLSDALIVPFVPVLFGMDKKNTDRFTPLVIKFVMWSMILVTVLIIIAGPSLIGILFGENFKPAYTSFLLLMPGMIAFSIYPFIKFDLFGRDLTLKVSYLTAVGFILNLVINILLIPRWGIAAAAFSSSVSYCVSTFLILLLYCRVSGNSLSRTVLFSHEELKMLSTQLQKKLRKRSS
jgi:O-antigen/teichoic acid export membrane protein